MSFDLQLTDNDLKIGTNGDIKIVTGTPKLRQDIIKILLTPLGSVKDHPWYGCYVGESSIGKTFSDNILISEIKISIDESLKRLQTLQISQAASQRVTLGEMISAVAGVHAERDVTDPRQINIFVTVITKKLEQVEELFTIIS